MDADEVVVHRVARDGAKRGFSGDAGRAFASGPL
jgi:hypothetical protein